MKMRHQGRTEVGAGGLTVGGGGWGGQWGGGGGGWGYRITHLAQQEGQILTPLRTIFDFDYTCDHQ
jgi:hypothetical protein